MLTNKKKSFLLKWGGIILFCTTGFMAFVFVTKNFLKEHAIKEFKNGCWNDIDFKTTEKMLLESSIKSKIPFYEYYKNQEIAKGKTEKDIIEDSFFLTRKKHHYNKKAIFVLFYHNGLKAIFKTNYSENLFDIHKRISAYNISKFLNLKIVPPAVMKNIDGQWGAVELFVENIKDYPPEYIDNLSPIQKSNLYVYTFITGIIDLSYSNILISKKCFLPVIIDNDESNFVLMEYGKIPYRRFPINREYSVLDKRSFKVAPFEKAVIFKKPSFEAIEDTFPGLTFKYKNMIRKKLLLNKSISYFKYKTFYFISFPEDLHKHLLPIKKYSDYSPQTIKRVKLLDERAIKSLAIDNLKESTTFVDGILHRRELFLTEIKRLKEK